MRRYHTIYERITDDDADVAELRLHLQVMNADRIDLADPADIVELAQQLGVPVSVVIHLHVTSKE